MNNIQDNTMQVLHSIMQEELKQIERALFINRRRTIEMAQNEYLVESEAVWIINIERPGFSPVQLRFALDGIAPIPFTHFGLGEGCHLFREFTMDLSITLKQEGYPDAQAAVIGSSATGYRGNPKKKFRPWFPDSDMDVAIVSLLLSTECKVRQVAMNMGFLVEGAPVLYKNSGPDGVHRRLRVGIALHNLERKWTIILKREVEFKINIETKPLQSGICFFVDRVAPR